MIDSLQYVYLTIFGLLWIVLGCLEITDSGIGNLMATYCFGFPLTILGIIGAITGSKSPFNEVLIREMNSDEFRIFVTIGLIWAVLGFVAGFLTSTGFGLGGWWNNQSRWLKPVFSFTCWWFCVGGIGILFLAYRRN